MKWYSIGEFAAQNGVTPDFIKYYEKQGLLVPKTSETGYRSYTAVRTSNVSECVKLKNMGFTAKEIHKLIKESDFEKTSSLFNSRRIDIERQIRYLQGMLDYTEDISKQLKVQAYENNKWNIGYIDDFYFLIQSKNFTYVDHGDRLHIIAEWQRWQPNVLATARVDNRPEGGHDVEWGLSVPAAFAIAQGMELEAPVERIPGGRYLTVYDKRELPDNQDNDDIEDVRKNMFRHSNTIIRQHNLKVTGPSYFIVQTKLRENGTRFTYQKILIPIE